MQLQKIGAVVEKQLPEVLEFGAKIAILDQREYDLCVVFDVHLNAMEQKL